ncbi:hypothetical protein CRV020 [Nile crocodilepox virus]|uniref:Uncharacterized protein n=1 Tax=Nile crocodilepox virus (isolate Crocodylus niloticus/Zimbabwe/Ume/2001) TaxID=1289473 RepID=Q070N1_CPRVZ|nr:hypothetical protein CRV020 [Nile crocodilepox virus]ABJ08911.1 hypothetical protein CRV020 [Nile crocodilepox virus]
MPVSSSQGRLFAMLLALLAAFFLAVRILTPPPRTTAVYSLVSFCWHPTARWRPMVRCVERFDANLVHLPLMLVLETGEVRHLRQPGSVTVIASMSVRSAAAVLLRALTVSAAFALGVLARIVVRSLIRAVEILVR